MRAFSLKGPVFGPALFHFVAADLSRRFPLYCRAPIGYGPRTVVRTDPARITTLRSRRVAIQRRPPRKGRAPLYAAVTGVLLLAVAAVGIGASRDGSRPLMTRADYASLRHAIDAEARLALANCRSLAGIEKEQCRARARADDRLRRAELEARYMGSVAALQDVDVARARGAYEIAAASCRHLPATEHVQCLRDARRNGATSGETKRAAT